MPTNVGMLLSYKFWPHWDSEGTNNSSYVEPDLFIEFEEFNVIIEAKYGTYRGQYKRQWQQEITAYHNEYGDMKPYIFIAVGGNMSVMSETIKVKEKEVEIYKCNWLSLLMNVNKYEKELSSISVPDMNRSATKRLLDNIILAFNIHQVYNIEWFDSMAQLRPTISTQSIEIIKTLFK
jgi:hypothetical protein